MAFIDFPDEAAELDDEPDETILSAPTLEPFSDGQARELHTAICRGGPWDGVTVESRYPCGFLLVHKPSRKLWIYDLSGDGASFNVRSAEPVELRDEGDDNRWRAANEWDYDIRVLEVA